MEQFSIYRFGDLVLDGSQRRLLRSGEDVYPPPKTFELLLHLLQNRGRVLTKDELLEAVWPRRRPALPAVGLASEMKLPEAGLF